MDIGKMQVTWPGRFTPDGSSPMPDPPTPADRGDHDKIAMEIHDHIALTRVRSLREMLSRWQDHIDREHAELTRLRARIAELEAENSRLRDFLIKTETKLAEYAPPFSEPKPDDQRLARIEYQVNRLVSHFQNAAG